MSDKTRAMRAPVVGAKVARSICPYCGVGCGQLIYHRDGKLVSNADCILIVRSMKAALVGKFESRNFLPDHWR